MIKIVHNAEPIIARALGLFGYDTIYFGRRYRDLPYDQQIAVFYHEVAHVELWHSEIRILALFTMPFLLPYICRKQELAADKFVAQKGLAKQMIKLLSSEYDGGYFQPSHKERREKLKMYEQTRLAGETSLTASSA